MSQSFHPKPVVDAAVAAHAAASDPHGDRAYAAGLVTAAAVLSADTPDAVATVAAVSAARPGLIPATPVASGLGWATGPLPYARWSATDSVLFSNLTGTNSGTAAVVGGYVAQVNEVTTGSTRYLAGLTNYVGGSIRGPQLVQVAGKRYFNFRPGDSFSGGLPTQATPVTLFFGLIPRRYDLDGLFSLGGGSNELNLWGGRINWFNQQPIVSLLAGRPGQPLGLVVRVTSGPTRRIEVFTRAGKGLDVADASTTAGSFDSLAVGQTSGGSSIIAGLDALVAEFGFHTAGLTDQQCVWQAQACEARCASQTLGLSALNLLVEGNSLNDPLVSVSSGAPGGAFGPPFSPTQMWPSQLAAKYPNWTFANLTVAGRTTVPTAATGGPGGNNVSETFAAHLATYYRAGVPNVVAISEGINHLLLGLSGAGSGVVAAQAVLALATTAISGSWTPVVETFENRGDTPGGYNTAYATEYLLANAYLRANLPAGAYLADTGGDARFQNPANGLYILASDLVHRTLLGQYVAASEFWEPTILTAAGL